MSNPFSKQNAETVSHSIETDKSSTELDFDSIMSSHTNISNETRLCLDWLHKKAKIVCTDSEIEQLDSITEKTDKIAWMKEKLYQVNLESIDSSMSKMLDEIDVFKSVKNPLDITTDELETIMSFKTSEEQKAEIRETVNKFSHQLRNTIMNDYVVSRNKRREDGTLDNFLSADELREIDRKVSEQIGKAQLSRAGVRDAIKLDGVLNTLNDMNVSTRYSYEAYKEGICNDFGVTPESFDEWFAAVNNDNMTKLNEDGIKIRTELYNVKESQIKHKDLLRRVPGWKKGDIVYVSDFNKKVRELDAKELTDGADKATPIGKQLFNDMVTDTFHSVDNPVKLKKSLVSQDDVKKFVRKRKIKPVTTTVENNTDDIKPPVVDQTSKHDDLDDLYSHQPKVEVVEEVVVPEVKIEEPVVEEPKSTVEPLNKSSVINHYVSMGLSIDQANILANNDMIKHYVSMGLSEEQANLLVNSEEAKEKPVVKQPEKSPEPVYEAFNVVADKNVIENKKQRYNGDKGSIDDYSKVIECEADPSILRSTSNRLQAIREYKNSAKRGRMLYLPNSNYEVYIKKIRNTESIGYMITLLNNMKDMNLVEAYVKSEVLRVLYDNIEFYFPEPVSYDDFIRCLHESDMTILMVMLALVNIPEDKDGKVPLRIKSLICGNSECGAIGNLREEMILDLKEEFTLIYPVELYAANYAAYKNANYQSIYHAYRDSDVGKLERYEVKDDMFEFKVYCSSPTVYKTQSVKSARDEVSYKRLHARIEERIDAYKSAGEVYDDVVDYMNTHTYQDYLRDTSNAAMNPDETDIKTKTLITTISDEMDLIKKEDLPFYLIMDAIDQISITTLDGEVVVDKLDQKDVFTMIGILAEDCPKELLEKIIETKNKSLDKSIPVDITFEAEELAGSFDFDGYYGTDEEMVEEIRSRYENASDEELEKVIETQRKIRDAHKPHYENEAKCFCGNDVWKLNYTAILFFWTSNLSQTLLK